MWKGGNIFINGHSGYNRHGEQTAKGDFLMIFCKESGGELRAALRHVRMRQCDHWMMASVKVGSHRFTLSGSYGRDGLPMNATKQEARKCWHQYHADNWYERTYAYEEVPAVNWESLVTLPEELAREFWHPEHQGWNSCGSEAKNMEKWARDNIKTLKNAGK